VLRFFARVNVVVRLFGGLDWAPPVVSPTTAAAYASSAATSSSSCSTTDGSAVGAGEAGGGSPPPLWKVALRSSSRNEDANMEIAITNLEIQLNELAPGTQVS
jgi:hypothetical protein